MNVVVDTTWRQGYVIVVNVVVVVNKGLQLDVTLSPRGEREALYCSMICHGEGEGDHARRKA